MRELDFTQSTGPGVSQEYEETQGFIRALDEIAIFSPRRASRAEAHFLPARGPPEINDLSEIKIGCGENKLREK